MGGTVWLSVGYYGFHYLGAAVWIVPFLFGFLGYRFFYEQKRGLRLRQGILAVVSLLSLSGLVAIVQDLVGVGVLEQSMANKLTLGVGGLVGNALVFNALKPILGPFGCILIFSVSFASSLYVGLGDNLSALFKGIFQGLAQVFQASFKVFKTLLAWIYESVLSLIKGLRSMASAFFKIFQTIRIPKVAPAEKAEGQGIEGVTKSVHNSGAFLDQPIDGTGKISRSAKAMSEPEPEPEAAHVATVEKKPPLDPASFKIIKGEKTEKAVASIPERRGDYVFPNINLLNNAPAISGYDSEDHAATMKALVDTLEQFGVKVIPGEIFTGPVITRYEVTPAAGVRVEKIVNLDKNIALGLKALSVRFCPPVKVPSVLRFPIAFRRRSVCVILSSRSLGQKPKRKSQLF